GLLERKHASGCAQDRLEVLAVDVLHRKEVIAVRDTDVVHLSNVRMRERRDQSSLIEKHLNEVVIRGELRQDPLERHDLLEALNPRRAREIQLRHSTDGEAPEQAVLAKPTVGSGGLRSEQRTWTNLHAATA